jgi:hypothetical protein
MKNEKEKKRKKEKGKKSNIVLNWQIPVRLFKGPVMPELWPSVIV